MVTSKPEDQIESMLMEYQPQITYLFQILTQPLHAFFLAVRPIAMEADFHVCFST